MIPGLNQLPAFLPLLMKESLQPFKASLKNIVDKTEALLITFDGALLFFGLRLWEFVNRNLVFPLNHRVSPKSKFQMPKFKCEIKSEIQVSKANFCNFDFDI
jgi:hypothetical protein